MPVTIRNPHSVLAALLKRPQDVTRINAPKSAKGATDPWAQVVRVAEQKRVAVHSSAGGPIAGNEGRGRAPESDGRAGSAGEAIIKDRASIPIETLFEGAKERAEGKGLWLALDNLQDPHNVGAIFRAAAFFGVQGIILTQDRSAPLTGTAYDVACGGIEHVPFTLQTNLQQAFEIAKEAGCWILGSSEHSKDSVFKIQRDRPWLLVLGNEEKGMRRLTEENCDVLCQIPPLGEGVTSLNVSVAAGILMSALTSQTV